MTKSRFRILLVLSLVTGLASSCIDRVFHTLVAEHLWDARALDQKQFYEGLSLIELFTLVTAGISALVATGVSLFGLYGFHRWAPPATILATALSVVCLFFFPLQIISGPALSLFMLSSILWGAVLVLCYTLPCSSWFSQRPVTGRPAN